MDKQSIELLLDQGESVERIAKRFGKDPSTVSYWMKKYGLTSPHAEKHAARGGIERERLEGLVNAGMTIAEIASEVHRSKATVRHWLREYGLKFTRGGRRGSTKAKEAGKLSHDEMLSTWRNEFVLEAGVATAASDAEQKSLVRRVGIKAIVVGRPAGGASSADTTAASPPCTSITYQS